MPPKDVTHCWLHLGQVKEPPYVIALIKLDGADSWFVSGVQGTAWEDFKVGMRVKAVWIDEPVGSMTDIDHFEVIPE